MWYLLALASAVFASIRRANEKQLSQQLNHFTIGWIVQLLSLPLLIVATVACGQLLNPLKLSAAFWLPMVLLWVGFYPLNQYLYLTAVKHGELSKILPLQSLGPVIALLLGLCIGQVPSFGAVLAIATIVAGIYALNMRGRKFHNPLHMFSRDKPNLFSLGSVCLVALAGVLDSIAIRASNPLYFCLVSTIGAVLVLYGMTHARRVPSGSISRKHVPALTVAGTLFSFTYIAYTMALNSGPLGYVNAIRGGAGVLAESLIGFELLKERITPNKLLGLELVVAGSTLLALT